MQNSEKVDSMKIGYLIVFLPNELKKISFYNKKPKQPPNYILTRENYN